LKGGKVMVCVSGSRKGQLCNTGHLLKEPQKRAPINFNLIANLDQKNSQHRDLYPS
jgi:hypothetical protein